MLRVSFATKIKKITKHSYFHRRFSRKIKKLEKVQMGTLYR